jgi:hypothetical protein
MGLNPLWDSHDHPHKLIEYPDQKFQTFAFIHPTDEKYGLTFFDRQGILLELVIVGIPLR